MAFLVRGGDARPHNKNNVNFWVCCESVTRVVLCDCKHKIHFVFLSPSNLSSFFFRSNLHRYYLAVALVDNLELVERVVFCLELVGVGMLVAAAVVEWEFQEREPNKIIYGK